MLIDVRDGVVVIGSGTRRGATTVHEAGDAQVLLCQAVWALGFRRGAGLRAGEVVAAADDGAARFEGFVVE